jgi:signal transduction histidine kinase
VRSPRSLRVRLVLAFVAGAAVVVIAAAAGMMVLIERAQWTALDASLAEEASTVATLRHVGDPAHFRELVAQVAREPDLGPGKFVRVTRAEGSVVAEAGTPPRDLAPVPPGGAAGTIPFESGGQAYRVAWYPSAGGWAVIGVPAYARPTTRARWTIAFATAALLAVLAGLAWVVTSRATRELDWLAAELETIEAGSLDRRLARRHTSEVDRLTSVLNRLLARLDTAMTQLRRFTADAAHELRTPVAALRTHLEVALGRGGTAESYRDGLVDALEQSERLGLLAENLLTLSGVEGGSAAIRPEPVHLDDLVREVAESVEPLAEDQGRRFSCHVGTPVVVRGDPVLLKRVILNLVDNALRHTPAGAGVDLSVASENGVATLAVRDRGPGIPPEDVPHVFERFHRGRTAGGGSGLGLALCREIVARHGGDIHLASRLGAGTTVTVTLPATGAPRH